MAQKAINVSQNFINYDGSKIIEVWEQDTTAREITLKDVLIRYILTSGRMGLTDQDQVVIHTLGFLIGKENGVIILTTEQYDALKRMVDNGKVKSAQGGEEAVFGNIIKLQAKDMVDTAENVTESQTNEPS